MRNKHTGASRLAVIAALLLLTSFAVWISLRRSPVSQPATKSDAEQTATASGSNGVADSSQQPSPIPPAATNNAPTGAATSAAFPGTDAGHDSKVLVRPSAETSRLAQRHIAALQKMGIVPPAAPAPRQPLSKIPLHQPPGQDLELLVKFSDALMARADISGNVVISADAPDEALQRLIDGHGLSFATSQTATEEDIINLEARALANTDTMPADLAGTLLVRSAKSDPAGVMAAAQALQSLSSVEFVTVTSRDEPPPPPIVYDIAPTTSALDFHQTYRGSLGININWAWAKFGAKGQGVRVTDCEYNFQQLHEDMRGLVSVQPGVASFFFFPDKPDDDNHGTASLGVLKSAENEYGMTGTVPDADAHFYADAMTNSAGVKQTRAATITAAAAASKAGDVLLLEMQARGNFHPAPGISSGWEYGPAELDQNVHTAVKTATAANIIVVAAAGNGAQNLDSTNYSEYMARPSSGAIIVGAGASAETSYSRSILYFSTYGSRVDVQGWGEKVGTLGYGDLAKVGDDNKQKYTRTYSGTSSASPVVTSAVVAIQSAARQVLGRPLTPAEMRWLLLETGKAQTPDKNGNGSFEKNIGPLPDVAKALANLRSLFGGTNVVAAPGLVDVASWKMDQLAGDETSVVGEPSTNGVTALQITRSPGLSSGGDAGAFATRGWAGASTDTNRYVSLGFTVAAGKRVFPADLLLTIGMPYTSGPADYALRYSGDNFQKNVATWSYKSGDPANLHLPVDLSKLGPLEGSVEFRIFVASEKTYAGGTLTDSGKFTLKNYSWTDSLRFTGSVESTDSPDISAVAPASGQAGTRVAIRGTKLGVATEVTVGGATAAFESGANDGEIFVTVPPDALTGRIVVMTPQGTATSRSVFSIVAGDSGPQIVLDTSLMNPSGFRSTAGSASPSRQFTVRGANLTGHLTVNAPAGYEISTDGTNYQTSIVLASDLPKDSATNYASKPWVSGSSAGWGFGAWQISKALPANEGNAGNSITNPAIAGITNFGTKAFCLYASPFNSGAKVQADRPLPGPLRVGDTFKFQWAVNLDGDGGTKGFVLYTGGAGMTPLVTVEQSSYPDAIIFGTASNAADTGLGTKDNGTAPMTWSFTRTAEDQLQVAATGRDGGTNVIFTTNVAIVGSPDSFRWYASELEQQNAVLRYPFYDNLAVVPGPLGGGFTVPSQSTVFVRLAANAPVGTVAGEITVTGGGAPDQKLALSGTAGGQNTAPPGYDSWVLANNLSPEVSGLMDDPDGDGSSNLLEFAMGTGPETSGGNGLSMKRPGSQIVMRYLELARLDDGLEEDPGYVEYVVQTTEDLKSGEWTDTDIVPTYSADQDNLPTDADYYRVEFEVSPSVAAKFYRVKVIDP